MTPEQILARTDPAELASRRSAVHDDLRARGVTFGVKDADGACRGHEVFAVEPVPRILDAATWGRLAAGVEQRLRALDRFLDDVYTAERPEEADIVRAGLMDAAVIRRAPGYTGLGHRVPAGTVRARITGADLVCAGEGTPEEHWAVLEDNVRMPSGLTFALAAREVLQDRWPEIYAPVGDRLTGTDGALEMFCDAVRGSSGVSGEVAAHVVVLTGGEADPTWSEQRGIAGAGGFVLRTCDGLAVRREAGGTGEAGGDSGAVSGSGAAGVPVLWDLTEDRKVDVVYLRITEDRLATGIPGIGDALAAGSVTVVNAPGNGLADDKTVYASVPAMVRHYLGEEPLLDQVPTWLCADPAQRTVVLDRLDDLVVKPVDGYGGAGITVGPECTRDRLDARRAEILADPASFIAQERVDLSTLPALDGTRRHVDLRIFSLLADDGGTRTVPAALTRVGPAGSLIVNSSRGGGGRDTWILTDQAR